MSTAISPTPDLSREPVGRLHRFSDVVAPAWMRLAESRIATFFFFGILYIWPTVALAHHRLLWDDEFFTLYLSKTRTWNDLIAALSTGADQHPPSFYYLTHLIFNLVGTTHITLRLPSIVGFGVACFCLYEIVSHILTRPWGIAAMLLPLVTNPYPYAIEGRGYGLEFGFVSFSVLMWILACEGTRRMLAIPLLAASLCAAVACHYYAVLALIPLAAGELVRTVRGRKIDLPVWLAFGGAFIPIVIFARTVLNARAYATHFWAAPHFHVAVEWYATEIGYGILLPVVAFAMVILLRISQPSFSSGNSSRIRSWHTVTISLFAFLPVLGFVVAELVTHAYTEHYMIAACLGVCILLTLGLRLIVANDEIGPALVCVMCLPFYFYHFNGMNRREFEDLKELRESAAILRRTADAPLAIADLTTFHRLSFYASRDLVRRLTYAADPHLSMRYLGQDTADRGLLALNPWFPLNVVWWHDWLSAHPSFLTYGFYQDWSWLPFELPAVANVQLLKSENIRRLLLSVQNVKVPRNDRTASDPPGEPMLYRQFAGLQAPLCTIYMTKDCPVVDGAGAGTAGVHAELK